VDCLQHSVVWQAARAPLELLMVVAVAAVVVEVATAV
jgi:hypothetical protein